MGELEREFEALRELREEQRRRRELREEEEREIMLETLEAEKEERYENYTVRGTERKEVEGSRNST